MIQIAGGFQFRDLYIYPEQGVDASPYRFFYFPINPQPETDSQGRPTLLSIPTGQGGFLQLGTHLGAGNEESELVETARQELMVRMKLPASTVETTGAPSGPVMRGVVNPVNILLEPAPLHVSNARLQLGSGEENASVPEDLAQNETSGFYPFTALFSVQLNAEQQAHVMSALNGRTGFLYVRYDASLFIPMQTSAHILGDIREIVAELVAFLRASPPAAPGVMDPVDPSRANLFNLATVLLEKTIAQGQMKVETQSSDSAPQNLSGRAIDGARQHMLELVVSEARRQAQTPPIQTSSLGLDLAHAETSASFTDSVGYPLSLVTDVASWFGGQTKGTDHLMLLPGK